MVLVEETVKYETDLGTDGPISVTGCSVMKDVLVINDAEAGGVLPPIQLVVPFSSVKE